MDGYSGIHLGQQGNFGKFNISGNSNAHASQGVDVTQLQAGDTFKGEIASVNGEDVQILLTNGQYMNARLERDVQIALGQVLNFQVQSNKDNKIVLKPLYDNNAQLIRVGEAALRAANIAVNEKNLNLVSNLLENGMSIDKNTILNINKLTIQNPEANVSEIIELNKLDVPVNDNNLNQLQSYENMQYKLIDGVNQTANEVLELYDTIAQDEGQVQSDSINGVNNLEVAGKFMEQVVELLSEDENPVISSTEVLKSEAANIETANSNVTTPEALTPDAPVVTEGQNVEPANVQNLITDSENVAKTIPDTIQQEQSKSNPTTSTTDKVNLNLPQDKTINPITKELATTKPEEIPTKIVKYINEGKLNIIKDVKQLLKDNNIGEKLTAEQKSEIFKSEPFKSLIKDTFQNRWTLTPKDISQEGKVTDFYEKLARETSKLSKMIDEAINESGKDVNTIQAKAASNMSENIEFVNQLNHMMNYVQLPLKLSDSQAHGDLYVYTNRKHMAGADGMLTAFLHLDMDNLGSVDVSIALQTDKNIVTTKFYLDEDVISLVEEHKDELIERLAKKGYQCKATLIEKDDDDDKTVLDHIEEQLYGQNALISYQSFDTRA